MREEIEYEDVIHDFFVEIGRVRQDARVRVQRLLEDSEYDGLTTEMWQVMYCLRSVGGQANQKTIAENLGKDKSSITSVINNLVKREMLDRVTDPLDRRHNIITFQEKGLQFMKSFYSKIYQSFDFSKTGLSLEDVRTMTSMLAKFIAS